MYRSTSVTAQLVRGVMAVASIAGGIVLSPHFWPAMGLFALAIYFMRGCPACWLVGLIEATRVRNERKSLL
ncbi:hypothetical protein [Pseudomonas sp. GD03696]|uniref:hypothetical protein n=1 Tax=Pseudomonas sp. GD03696 TaxID=2975368 RepID=UPI002447BCF2|nr:hypothetical protein [Pseudomonas sp. GD03696]MDH1932819.1 hypothetical protein [Pseudomonas sp. GD03696]